MDINETLRLIRATIAQMRLEDGPVSAGTRPEFVQHARDLAEYAEAADQWLSKDGFLPKDWERSRIEHGEFIVELSKGDEPIPQFVSVDHPLIGRLHIYRHVDADDSTYIVVEVDSVAEKQAPPVRVYIDDALVYTGDSAHEEEED